VSISEGVDQCLVMIGLSVIDGRPPLNAFMTLQSTSWRAAESMN
jgi:hypothetical protein